MAPAPAGFTNVAGTAIAAHLAPTTIALDIARPRLHVELLVRGAASAQITGVTVDGRSASVAWDGGTPIDLVGAAATVTTPVAVDLNSNGMLVHLDGAQVRLEPGSWRLTGPVAVGTTGLATPRDSVKFDVPAAGATITFHGGAGVRIPAGATQTFEGPGRLSLDGTFATRTHTAQRSLAHVRTPATPFRLTVQWINGVMHMSGTVQGAVQ